MPGMVLHGELSGQQSSVWRLLVNTHWIGEVEELVMYVIMADSLLLLFVHFFQETVWETAGSQPTDSEEAGGHFDRGTVHVHWMYCIERVTLLGLTWFKDNNGNHVL